MRHYAASVATVADRVVQAALKLVLEPIFEADFQPCSYRFRPGRRAHDAISEIQLFATQGYTWALEADIRACFDEIGHVPLMDRLRARIKDRRVLALVKAFLKAGVMTADGGREESYTGTPAGGILSPLLANIALSALDDHFTRQWHELMGTRWQREKRRRKGLGTWRLVRYADDWVTWSAAAVPMPRHCAKRQPPSWPRWGCGWPRRKPAWSTSTRASTSWASRSAGCGNEAPRSSMSTRSRPGRPSRPSRTRSQPGHTGRPGTWTPACSSRASTGPWPGGRTTSVTECPKTYSARSTPTRGAGSCAGCGISTPIWGCRNCAAASACAEPGSSQPTESGSPARSQCRSPLPLPRQHTDPVGTPAGPSPRLAPAGKARGAPGALRGARRVRRAGRGNPPGKTLAGRPGPTQPTSPNTPGRRWLPTAAA